MSEKAPGVGLSFVHPIDSHDRVASGGEAGFRVGNASGQIQPHVGGRSDLFDDAEQINLRRDLLDPKRHSSQGGDKMLGQEIEADETRIRSGQAPEDVYRPADALSGFEDHLDEGDDADVPVT